LLERRGIRIRRRQLFLERVAYVFVDDEIVTRARQQLRERHLIVVVGLESELSTVVTVWEDGLVQLTDVKRLPEMLGKSRANRSHEMAVHPVEVVHRCRLLDLVVGVFALNQKLATSAGFGGPGRHPERAERAKGSSVARPSS